MTVDEMLAYYGGQRKKAAAALNVSYQAVVGWERAGKIPFLRQCHIELVTGLTADLPDPENHLQERGRDAAYASL